MTVDHPLPLTWIPKGLARWYRYEVEGLEQLLDAPTGLLVGYHGRPFSWDILLLGHRLYERTGRYPVAFVADVARALPFVRKHTDRIGAQYGRPDAAAVQRAREEGRHFMVAPGGLREALRPVWKGRYTLDFGARRGYIVFALEHGLPIYPVVATGVDDAYWNLIDGYQLSRRLFGHGKVPLIFSVGIGGVFPFALPFPVHVRQRIGKAIDVAPLRERCARDGSDLTEALHVEVTRTMQQMLDELRSGR